MSATKSGLLCYHVVHNENENAEMHVRVTEASHPFNKATADVILRTSDFVDFRIRKSILAEASPVFEGVFHLPVSEASGRDDRHEDDTNWKDGLPVIAITEDSGTLDRLLRLCYPVADPQFGSLDEVRSVLEAALKYMMEEVVPIMRKHLVSEKYSHSLRAFAIACRHNMDVEARLLARRMLDAPLDGKYISEMEQISAGAYYRLMQFHKNRGVTSGLLPRFCNPPRSPSHSEDVEAAHQASALVRVLVTSYPYLLAKPDATLRTSDGAEIPVHSLILGTVSPTFRHMFIDLEQGSEDSEDEVHCEDVPRVFQIPEDGQTMGRLLQFCYPVDIPTLDALPVVRSLLVAARKYEVSLAIDAVSRRLLKLAESSPLRVYAISCAHRWVPEARTAARLTLRKPLGSQYVEELEDASAGAYFRLLRYREECAWEASKCALSSPIDGCLSVDDEWMSFVCSEKTCRKDNGFCRPKPTRGSKTSQSVPAWWGKYVRSSALALTFVPWGPIITEDERLGAVLAEATACPSCRVHAYTQVRKFSTILCAEVECALSAITIDIQ